MFKKHKELTNNFNAIYKLDQDIKFDKDNIFLADPHFGKIKKHKISWFEERWFDLPFSKKPAIKEIIVIRK